jgi:CBS domain-containing protein
VNEYFFRFRHHSFPVVDNNQVRGLITLHEVKAIPREEWSKVMVGQIMLPLKTDLFVTEKASPLVALTKMASNNVGRLLIMENDQLQGIVSQRDFLNLFEFKAEIED